MIVEESSEEKRKLEEQKAELERENIELREKAQKLEKQLAELEAQYRILSQRHWGRRSERFENPDQIDIFKSLLELPDPPEKATESEESPSETEEISYTRKRSRPRGPKPLPEHLPRDRVEIDPPEWARICGCCQKPMVRVGEKVTEELTVKPPEFRVTETVQGEYACETCMNRPITEPLPPRPIENGRPSSSLLAFLVTSKYADHRVPSKAVFGDEGKAPRSRVAGPGCKPL